MGSIVRSTDRVAIAGMGILFALIAIPFLLISIQGMSGDEPLLGRLLFLSIGFAVAFGVGMASAAPLTKRYRPWPAAWDFAIGGAVGGAFLAVVLEAITRFDSQLRTVTGGGPTGVFLVGGILAALGISIGLGMALSRRSLTERRSLMSTAHDKPERRRR